MKFFLILIFLFFFQNCSFDNKSGIWENENKVSDKNKLFKDFEALSTKDSIFNKEILFKKDSQLKLENPIFIMMKPITLKITVLKELIKFFIKAIK